MVDQADDRSQERSNGSSNPVSVLPRWCTIIIWVSSGAVGCATMDTQLRRGMYGWPWAWRGAGGGNYAI